jgi:hypothetical protein
MAEQDALICCKCDIPLVAQKTSFTYMGFNFSTDLPRCPQCHQVFIPEELVQGKMASVEMELEEK